MEEAAWWCRFGAEVEVGVEGEDGDGGVRFISHGSS